VRDIGRHWLFAGVGPVCSNVISRILAMASNRQNQETFASDE